MGPDIEQQILLYGRIQTIAGIAALIFLAAAAFLFFRLRILRAVGELTGKRASRELRRMASEPSGSGRSKKTSGSPVKKREIRKSEPPDGGTVGLCDENTRKLRAPETAVIKPPDFAVERTIMLIHTDETREETQRKESTWEAG